MIFSYAYHAHFLDSVKEDIELRGLKEEDVKDRNNWRRLVHSRTTR